MKIVRSLILVAALLGSLANARIVFEATEFPTSSFRGIDKLTACGDSNAPFLCDLLDATLTRIPTKGVDYFFDDAGQLVAAFAKVQKGQNLKDYTIDGRTNLIPFGTQVPGAALLADGRYLEPEDPRGSWRSTSETDLIGTFRYRAGDYDVERTVSVSAIRETFEVSLRVTSATVGAGANTSPAAAVGSVRDPVQLQVAVAGIGRAEAPVVKIGHGTDFTLNPGDQRYQRPSYASVQNNNKNTADAIIMRPAGADAAGFEASFIRPDMVAFGRAAEPDGSTELAVTIYTGRNELVRYYQEGYLDLPGLFRPNIIGRLSLLVVQLLEFIHGYVGGWGLAIIVLTLLFRAAIWPLIATQTKSMFGMQKLQPKIKELQGKYKDDKEKLTQETMKMYQEAGVNPAGGCLPILLQMPLFIILWRVFVNFEFNEGFLWLPDLGQSDPIYILPVLYVIVMMATSWFSAKGNPQTLRQSMFINLVFVVVIIGFPSGVLVYYVVSMLVQVIQYWLLNRNQPAPVAVPVKRSKRAK